MNINFETLKVEFKEYLESLGIKPKLNEDDELTSASIFTYSKQFKDFINEEYKLDLEEEKLEFSELLENDVRDGKFVISDEDSNTEKGFMLELLNAVFEEEEFAKNIDEDGVDGLNEEEIKKFLTFANDSNYRDDEESFSFADLQKGFEKVNDGKYDASKVSLEDETSIPEVTPSTGGGGGSSGGSGSVNNSSSNNNSTKNTPKTLDQMDTDELEGAYSEQQKQVLAQQQIIDTTITQNEENVSKAKEEYDKATSEDNINPELLNQREQNLNQITQTDTTINQLNSKIADLDTQIMAKDHLIASIDANISGLEAAKATLSTAPSDDPEAQAEVKAKAEAIPQQITEFTNQKNTAIQEKQALEAQKTEAQTSLDENTTKLAELETQKTAIEEQILQTCNENTKAALENYNKARDAAKASLTKEQDNLKTEKEELAEIKKYLDESYKEDAIDNYGYSPKAKAFIPFEGYSEVTDIEKTNMDYKVLLANGADTSKELPVIVFLHGSGGSKNTLLNQALHPDNLAKDGVTTAFNGYIICPTLSGSTDAAAQNIDEILNSFSKNHKIDKDNIVLVGYSMGGTYAAGIASSQTFNDNSGYEFSKVALLTGYNKNKISFNMPVGIWVDSSSTGLKNTIEYDENNGDKFVDWTHKSHNDMEDDAFREDTNGDGKADVIQWLFDDE